MSKGEEALRELLKEEFAFFTVIEQHTIKQKRRVMYLDFYLPQLNLAFEFDGVQHQKYTPFYHKTRQGFEESKKRDSNKEKYCEENSITLIRIRYNEDVTKETLREKIKNTLDKQTNL